MHAFKSPHFVCASGLGKGNRMTEGVDEGAEKNGPD